MLSWFERFITPWNSQWHINYQWFQLLIYLFLLLDNDKPTISTSNPTPLEYTSAVTTLSCNPATTDSISGYEWYKDNQKISNAAAHKYNLPVNDRANSGSYKCKVVSVNAGTSQLSDEKTVTFLCKFDKLFLFYFALVEDGVAK